ncbi:hypothetical protein ACS125_18555 [Acinetobacter sp. PFS20]|uniref:hypothetical protein n=1 Tax=Acinetobacter sp. PFS20 TaxID=3458434 RepID=UPI003FD4CB5D
MSLAYVAVGAAVLSAAISGYSAYSTNKTQQEQAEADADASKASGRLEAERILKQKNRVQSAARAQAAENGLSVNEGTTVTINDKIEQDAQYDAAMSEISGFNASQRLRAEASIYKSNANTAAATGVLNTVSAGASGLSKAGGGSGSKGGWK